MPQHDHSTVRPGDEVVVTITGTVATRNTATGTLTIRTTDGALALTPKSDDVHVAPVGPEQLTVEALLEQHMEDYDYDCDVHGGCSCAELRVGNDSGEAARLYRAHVARVLREAGVAR